MNLEFARMKGHRLQRAGEIGFAGRSGVSEMREMMVTRQMPTGRPSLQINQLDQKWTVSHESRPTLLLCSRNKRPDR
jgi:hypothetical protein